MTPRQQSVMNWIGLIGVATIFGAGTAWGVTTIRLMSLEEKVQRIDSRVGEMYCASIPPAQRGGCR